MQSVQAEQPLNNLRHFSQIFSKSDHFVHSWNKFLLENTTLVEDVWIRIRKMKLIMLMRLLTPEG